MSYRIATAVTASLVFALLALPLPAKAQARGGGAGAAQPAERLHVVRRLNTAYRFTPPVRTVATLRTTMTRANIQRDIGTLLDQAGLSSVRDEVVRNLTQGTVTPTTISPGTMLVWMAERRSGRPLIMRPTQWAGRAPFRAHQFEIDDRQSTYTFIVPEDCGNISLLRQEPSRIAAAEREAAAAKAAADKAAADKAAAAKAAADKAAATRPLLTRPLPTRRLPTRRPRMRRQPQLRRRPRMQRQQQPKRRVKPNWIVWPQNTARSPSGRSSASSTVSSSGSTTPPTRRIWASTRTR